MDTVSLYWISLFLWLTYPFVCCTRKLPDELTNCNLSCCFHSIQAINGSVIAIVPSWIKGKCFRLPESLLVYSNKKLEYETRSVKSLKDGQRRICSSIRFLKIFLHDIYIDLWPKIQWGYTKEIERMSWLTDDSLSIADSALLIQFPTLL